MQNAHNNPRAFVGAFGKHPGWNDHIDDIGLETDRLVAFKRLLYIEGISGNVDAGTWEKLSPEQKLDGFGSDFLSLAGSAPLLGRMWASQDGKGRGRYPMVVCAQVPGQPLAWLMESAGPLLERIEAGCRAAKTADGVRQAVGAARDDLAAKIPVPGTVPFPVVPPALPGKILADLVLALQPIQNGSGFQRVVYKVERDMMAFLKDAGPGGRSQGLCQQIRVPSVMDRADRDLMAWTTAMLCLLDPAVSLFLNRPAKAGWVDILVGAPKTLQFYCLLASRQAIPSATDVPYNMDAPFVEKANRLADIWRSGGEDVNKLLARVDGTRGGGAQAGWLGRIRNMFRS